jgi:hypothetical protein
MARIADWFRTAAIPQAGHGTAGKQHKRSDQRQHHVSFHKFPFAPSVELAFGELLPAGKAGVFRGKDSGFPGGKRRRVNLAGF